MMLLLILLMGRVLLSFPLKLNSHQSCTFTSPSQQTLKRIFTPRTTATVLKYAETLTIQMAFKQVIA